MDWKDAVEAAGKFADALGVVVTVVGVVVALAISVVRMLRPSSPPIDGYRELRRNVGRSILLGLELLVAGDIIRTVAVSPSFASVGVLAIIVVIRTFLSFTLEVELTTRWPWEKDPAAVRAADMARRA
jgi:uncharacterized membrane protein